MFTSFGGGSPGSRLQGLRQIRDQSASAMLEWCPTELGKDGRAVASGSPSAGFHVDATLKKCFRPAMRVKPGTFPQVKSKLMSEPPANMESMRRAPNARAAFPARTFPHTTITRVAFTAVCAWITARRTSYGGLKPIPRAAGIRQIVLVGSGLIPAGRIVRKTISISAWIAVRARPRVPQASNTASWSKPPARRSSKTTGGHFSRVSLGTLCFVNYLPTPAASPLWLAYFTFISDRGCRRSSERAAFCIYLAWRTANDCCRQLTESFFSQALDAHIPP